MKILEYMAQHGYEQVVFCHDPGVGLKAIIAIHDTTLGPALGGVRLWEYPSEEEAVRDVLRLGQAMTYKAAAAGLNLGGGKIVVMGPVPQGKREALFRSLGRFIHSLGGRYISTEDVGTYIQDMEHIQTQTHYVTGLPLAMGGSGDPSVMTALGVLQAMKACAQEVWGSPSLQGKKVALQGVGKVGYYLARHLVEEGAEVVASDIKPQALERVGRELGIKAVAPEAIYELACDIFSPNALGGVLNSQTIPRLKCKIVCGAANNQLEEEADGDRLHSRGILYAPDFIANAGGIINISLELGGYDEELAREKTMGIHQTMEKVIARSKAENLSPSQAANRLAQDRLASVRAMKSIYQGE